MKKIFTVAFLSFVLSVSNFPQTPPPESDFQFWSESQIAIPLKKSKDKKTARISLLLYGTLRVSRNLEDFVDKRFGLGFEFRFNKNLTFTPNYLYIADRTVKGARTYESRFRFDLGLEKKFKNFTLKNRNRVEHRIRYSRTDSTRYRNRLQIFVPVKKDDKEIFAPFVSTEPFYEFQSKHWTRNELTLGISKKFNPNVTADFYYMLQNNRGNTLRYVNITGVNFKFTID